MKFGWHLANLLHTVKGPLLKHVNTGISGSYTCPGVVLKVSELSVGSPGWSGSEFSK